MSKDLTPEELGKFRQGVHPTGTERFYDDPNTEDIRGAVGELEFARQYGFEPDLTAHPFGDNGVDFRTPAGIVDVKTANIPKHLLVKEKEMPLTRADIFILAKDNGNGRASFLGWEWKTIMARCPVRDIGKKGIRSHYMKAERLRPMSEFDALLGVQKKQDFPYILVNDCKFVPDNKNPSHRMIGYYYCAAHQCRTSSAAQSCTKGQA